MRLGRAGPIRARRTSWDDRYRAVPEGHRSSQPKVVTWLPAVAPTYMPHRECPVRLPRDHLPPGVVPPTGLLLGARRRPAWVADFGTVGRSSHFALDFRRVLRGGLMPGLSNVSYRRRTAVVGATSPIARDLGGAGLLRTRHMYRTAGTLAVAPAESAQASTSGVVCLVYTGIHDRSAQSWPMYEALNIAELNTGRAPNSSRPRRAVHERGTRTPLHVARPAHSSRTWESLDHAAAIELQRSSGRASSSSPHATAQRRPERSSSTSPPGNRSWPLRRGMRPSASCARRTPESPSHRTTSKQLRPPFAELPPVNLLASYKPTGLERYTYPGPAEAMAEVIEKAIARKALAR